ncbi:ATPase [Caulobacter sp. CCUG 60055]|uniref:SRPBCC domain-containing protein n=1 Tax=Caulobacter sp. CCUG 60055 TaxID=2100090 RepID=UPI001FA7CFBA|nr:SRPBCC domain-containing protein [Caulobacter sp. CCUG 60055]MCI3182339.1 ATPase [Caulobacter sp. CCUG 60055]
MTRTPFPKPLPACEIEVSRFIAAPRDQVFKAWIEPARLAAWWGPAGFSSTVAELSPCPGGALRLVMHGPDGVDHPMSATFRELAAPERIAFVAVAGEEDGGPVLEALTIALFAERDGGVEVRVHARAAGLAPGADAKLQGMEIGWTQSLARLDALFTKGDAE